MNQYKKGSHKKVPKEKVDGKEKDNHQKKILKNPENIYGPIFVGEKKKLEYMCSVSDSVKKKKLETFQQSEKVK